MIPSDHFVRFYNEVFKFLDEKEGLQDYYTTISEDQEKHCLKLYREGGIRGIYEYYLRIRKEENCDLAMELTDDGHGIYMHFAYCASLAKALDNDAGVCPKYCFHCPGWSGPMYRKAGLFYIKDLIDPLKPCCTTWGYDNHELAVAKYRQLLREGHGKWLMASFDVADINP